MLVKISFNNGSETDNIESTFDSVEFGTINAGTYQDWASAVLDFAASAGGRFDAKEILVNTLTIEGGWIFDKYWDRFAEKLDEASRVAIVEAIGRARAKEASGGDE
jgi:hypothetical protein